MTPERWRQVEEIFQVALDLVPEERLRYLSVACAHDTQLKRDVESLLSQYDSAGALLDEPVYGNTELNVFESFIEEKDPMIGRRLGSYRIEREIGRGGMGAVYEALRADNEFNKRAAIKLVKRGMDTDFILRRFRKERQILAALDHPHIGGGGLYRPQHQQNRQRNNRRSHHQVLPAPRHRGRRCRRGRL